MQEVKSGIYKILNKINNKIYIGSSKNIKRRWCDHRRRLIKKTHDNEYLQRAWDKYGEESFGLIVLEECAPPLLIKKEQYYLDLYKSYKKNIGYNISPQASAGVFSEETKEKLRRRFSGGDNPFYGKKHSEETKKKISLANNGKHLSEETKRKMSISWKYEKHFSEEIKRKMGMARRGENGPNAKLTWREVNEIRHKYKNLNCPINLLAKEYRVEHKAIRRIIKNITWKEEFNDERKNNN